jgi:hypothetical protein
MDIPPLIGHESKASRASCVTFSLLVVLYTSKVRAHSLVLTYQFSHRRIQSAERERIHPRMPDTIISRSFQGQSGHGLRTA